LRARFIKSYWINIDERRHMCKKIIRDSAFSNFSRHDGSAGAPRSCTTNRKHVSAANPRGSLATLRERMRTHGKEERQISESWAILRKNTVFIRIDQGIEIYLILRTKSSRFLTYVSKSWVIFNNFYSSLVR